MSIANIAVKHTGRPKGCQKAVSPRVFLGSNSEIALGGTDVRSCLKS